MGPPSSQYTFGKYFIWRVYVCCNIHRAITRSRRPSFEWQNHGSTNLACRRHQRLRDVEYKHLMARTIELGATDRPYGYAAPHPVVRLEAIGGK